MNKKWLIGLGLCIAAHGHAAVSAPNIETVKRNLHANLPVNIENIQATPIPNIFSGFYQGRVMYFDAKGEYFMTGDMVRIADQVNLTEKLLNDQQRVDWDTLPFDQALKTVKGKGERQIAVFSDPNCPYCQRFEQELDKLENVTIYTFIYALKAPSVELSKRVWCEKNREQAWQDLLTKKIQPSAKASCDNPIEANLKLGKELQITGTPSIIFPNGSRQMGAVTHEQLEKLIQQHLRK